MPRQRTDEEIRRLQERGIFDVGTTYIRTRGFERIPKHRFWDGYVQHENG